MIQLNVSGVTEGFFLPVSMLTKIEGSKLAAQFSGRFETKFNDKGEVMFNLDPRIFRVIVEYLRFSNMNTIYVEDEEQE
jgi:hypothetical protein